MGRGSTPVSEVDSKQGPTLGSLKIRRVNDDRGTVIELAGELDLESAP